MTAPLTFVPPWSPSPGTTDTPEVKVEKADFGDGYSQASHMLNNVRRVLALKWDVLSQDDANAITSFLAARCGTEPFFYRFTGDATALLWTCEAYSQGYAAANWRSVTATFRQSFVIV